VNQTPASYPDPNPAPPSPAPVSIRLPSTPPTVTYTILGVTIAVYLLQMLSQATLGYDLPIALGAKINESIRAGQLWRLLTPMLLHGSIFHIGFNMYALYSFGVGLERRFGHGRFLLLYLLGGFAGNVLSFLITANPSVGSSTAVFGIVAAEGVFLYQNRKLFGTETKNAINNVVMTVIINLLIGFTSGGIIDNWGHIGGLLGGLIFTWFSGPLWEVEGIYPLLRLVDRRSEPRDMIMGAAVVLLIFGALAFVGLLWPLV
jgi:rhomboid protease GluP